MPNPFTKNNLRRKDTPSHQPIEPVLEEYIGDVHAYRGTEDHGVHVPGDTYQPVPVWSERDGTKTKSDTKSDADPIPVRIVDHSRREVQGFTTNQFPFGPNETQRIVGANDRRITLVIKNIGANSVWIGNDVTVSTFNGFELAVGATLDKLPVECAVYATAIADAKLVVLQAESL